jgi:hypothetical protein
MCCGDVCGELGVGVEIERLKEKKTILYASVSVEW